MISLVSLAGSEPTWWSPTSFSMKTEPSALTITSFTVGSLSHSSSDPARVT